MYFATAVGTLAVLKLRIRPERFARRAIPSLVLRFINIALFVKFFKYRLNGSDVIGIGSTDKPIVTDIERFPYVFQFVDERIDKLHRRNALFGGFLFYFLTMFVRAGKKENLFAFHSVISCEPVANNGGIASADGPMPARIVNRRCNIVSIIRFHQITSCRKISFSSYSIY